MGEKPNRELMVEVFDLITNGFHISGDLVDPANKEQTSEVLQLTKEWRRQLWVKLHEIDSRMCPRAPRAPPTDYRKMMLDRHNAKKATSK